MCERMLARENFISAERAVVPAPGDLTGVIGGPCRYFGNARYPRGRCIGRGDVPRDRAPVLPYRFARPSGYPGLRQLNNQASVGEVTAGALRVGDGARGGTRTTAR